MGYIKYNTRPFINKRNFYLIKTYSLYRKDFWGILRWKRLYKYKRVIYNILKRKRKYYYKILNLLYNGIKFYIKEYYYKAFLLFVKKRIKLFYKFLRDKYIGKLGKLVKKKKGLLIDYFFSLLERRIDVLLIKSLYVNNINEARLMIFKKLISINNRIIQKPAYLVLINDFVKILFIPINYFFFQYYYPSIKKDLEIILSRFYDFYHLYQKTFIHIRKNRFFYKNFIKKILNLDLIQKYDVHWLYILKKIQKFKNIKNITKLKALFENSLIYTFNLNFFKKKYFYKYIKPINFELIRLISLRLYKILLIFIEFQIFLKILYFYKEKKISFYQYVYFLKKYILRKYIYITMIKIRDKFNKIKSKYQVKEYKFFYPLGIKKFKKNFNFQQFLYFIRIRVKRDFIKNFNLLRFSMSTLFYMTHWIRKYYHYNNKKEFIKLYGLTNLRLRIFYLYKIVRPKYFKSIEKKLNPYLIYLNKKRFKYIKKFRCWNFSYYVYLYFKRLFNIIYIYKGYPSYLEINYKIHIFILIKLPTIITITYPFTVDKFIFFDYFRRKGYF